MPARSAWPRWSHLTPVPQESAGRRQLRVITQPFGGSVHQYPAWSRRRPSGVPAPAPSGPAGLAWPQAPQEWARRKRPGWSRREMAAGCTNTLRDEEAGDSGVTLSRVSARP